MFGWFRPTCPCDPAAKHWIEERLRWLSGQFGLHILLERPIILPTAEYFPDPWDGTPRAFRRMFRRVCEYMEVDSDTVEVQLYSDRTPGSIAALDPNQGFARGYGKTVKARGENRSSVSSAALWIGRPIWWEPWPMNWRISDYWVRNEATRMLSTTNC